MRGLHFCWRSNWTLIRRLLIIFTWRYWKEGDLYEVCSTESHRCASGTLRDKLWRLTQICQTVPHVPICFTIGEESWVFRFIAETKHQSMEWRTELFVKVEEQTIFEHFSQAACDLQTIFAWRKNMEFCYRCWKVYWTMFWEGGHNFESGGGHLRFLLCDNTRAHSAMIMKCMLANCGMLAISHPL